MTRDELAQKLNGRQYREEITKEEEKEAKNNNLVIIFGASDDLVEFRGVIYDELGIYCGDNLYKLFYIKYNGDVSNDTVGAIAEIKVWFSPDFFDCTWYFDTKVPHSFFYIKEDDRIFCKGIVIDLREID